MEVLTAIALLCQINIGVGTGAKIYKHRMDEIYYSVATQQKTCQKKLAACISADTGDYTRSALKCIKDR